MELIELCKYTLSKSFSDTGEYYNFKTAQELLEEIQ